jgi:hypothetical protein
MSDYIQNLSNKLSQFLLACTGDPTFATATARLVETNIPDPEQLTDSSSTTNSDRDDGNASLLFGRTENVVWTAPSDPLEENVSVLSPALENLSLGEVRSWGDECGQRSSTMKEDIGGPRSSHDGGDDFERADAVSDVVESISGEGPAVVYEDRISESASYIRRSFDVLSDSDGMQEVRKEVVAWLDGINGFSNPESRDWSSVSTPDEEQQQIDKISMQEKLL